MQYFDFHTLGIPWNGVLDLPQFGIADTDPVYCIDWPSTAIAVDSDTSVLQKDAAEIAPLMTPSAQPITDKLADPSSTVDEVKIPAEEDRPYWDTEEEFTIVSEDEELFEELNAALPESNSIVNVSQEDEQSSAVQTNGSGSGGDATLAHLLKEIRQMRESTSFEMREMMESTSLQMAHLNDKLEAIRADSHKRGVAGETFSPSVEDPESVGRPLGSRQPSKRLRPE